VYSPPGNARAPGYLTRLSVCLRALVDSGVSVSEICIRLFITCTFCACLYFRAHILRRKNVNAYRCALAHSLHPSLYFPNISAHIPRDWNCLSICNCGRIYRYSAHLSSCNGTYLPQPSLYVPLSIAVFGYLKFASTACPLLRSILAYS